jgi:hypothetical protein
VLRSLYCLPNFIESGASQDPVRRAGRRSGVEPDLLDEIIHWQTDDFWFYALAAVVAVIRACAEGTGESVPAFTERLAARAATT